MVVHGLNPSTQEAEVGGSSLDYGVSCSYRTARTLLRNPVSIKQTNKQTNQKTKPNKKNRNWQHKGTPSRQKLKNKNKTKQKNQEPKNPNVST